MARVGAWLRHPLRPLAPQGFAVHGLSSQLLCRCECRVTTAGSQTPAWPGWKGPERSSCSTPGIPKRVCSELHHTNSVPSLLLLSKLYFGGFSECEAADSWNVEGMFISCISHPCDCHVQSQAPFSSWHHNISTPDAPPWAAAGYCLREEQAGDSSQSSCQPGDLFLVPFWDCRSSTWSWLCVFF